MWVRLSDGKLAFLLGEKGFLWTKQRFDSLQAKVPQTTVTIRKPNGALDRVKLSELRFDSEAIHARA